MTAVRERRGSYVGAFDAAAEVALASMTVVVVMAMQRLFDDTSFLRDVLAFALASHLVASAARRARLSSSAATLTSAACLVMTVTLLNYRPTTWMLLPTSRTLSELSEDLLDAWALAQSSPAPIEPSSGLVLAAGVAMWVIALVADTAAFRAGSAVLAVAPTGGVLAFISAAGVDAGWIRHSVLYCAAAAAALIAFVLRRLPSLSWIEGRPGRGSLAMGRTAVTAAALAVAAAAYAGPSLPGAQAAPWLDAETFGVTDKSRVVLSPLVEVRGRLVTEQDRELFTVEVPREARQYWRLMSLDEVEGGSWRSRSRFEDATGRLPTAFGPAVSGSSLEQTISLKALGGEYLPVAHELRRVISDGGVAMEYEASSGALIRKNRAGSQGLGEFSYEVESVLPRVEDPEMLRGVSIADIADAEFAAFNVDLPLEVRRLVASEARRVTAEASTDYERALALQDYFWAGGAFRYDLNATPMVATSDLERFLFLDKSGYCEHFASAFAMMARSVRLPARIAVGFTWGDWDAARGVYSVRGEHAHAWPEVYFEGIGWVRFEPTPGRGAPDDFAVTGRAPGQSGGEDEPAPTTTAPPSGPSASPGDGSGAGPRGTTASGGASTSADSGLFAAAWLKWPLSALALAVLAMGAVPSACSLSRRRRCVRFAGDAAKLVELSWQEAVEALGLMRFKPMPSETPLETATRASAMFPRVGPLKDLATLATAGLYGRDTPVSAVSEARARSFEVVQACRAQAHLARRLLKAVDPRRLFAS